jgi:hypothetical protein
VRYCPEKSDGSTVQNLCVVQGCAADAHPFLHCKRFVGFSTEIPQTCEKQRDSFQKKLGKMPEQLPDL